MMPRYGPVMSTQMNAQIAHGGDDRDAADARHRPLVHARPVTPVVDPADKGSDAAHQRGQRNDDDSRDGEADGRGTVHHQGANRLLEGHPPCIAECPAGGHAPPALFHSVSTIRRS